MDNGQWIMDNGQWTINNGELTMDNSSQSSEENGMVFRKLKTNKTTTNDTNFLE